MNAPIEFETQRLRLRQWRAADREPFAGLNADPIVMTYFPAPLTRPESDAMVERCESPAIPVGHKLRAHCVYRLSRDGWFSSR
jgi:RimJ/RimL family protein N-acetyltransferase